MKAATLALVAALSTTPVISAAPTRTPLLLPPDQVAALVNELSGETAKRNLEGLARFHRQRGSQGFSAAAQLVAERARAYGLSSVEILRFPADGTTYYGTQRSRLGWDAEEGELSEVTGGREVRIASYAAEPIVLAEDSESADVTAELVDVGDGTKDADYAGKDVKGKIVLVAAAADSVQNIAIGKFGAVGIVSYAQNQTTAWSGDDDNLIRWGHLDSFSPHKTFAFMVSLRNARAFRERLRNGEVIRLHAKVTAGQHAAAYEVVTATIDGADPALRNREIAFSCHLDHQRPGANDNASGCVTILESARTLQKLITEGKLPRPARTLRFIWPPEVEGTVTLLNAKPEFAQRIQAVIHMDMVGGGPQTKALFHVTRGPWSLPSFVHDVAWSFASWVNVETERFASGLKSEYPMVAPEGGKEPLRAEYAPYTMGSDHQVYQDSTFRIPSIYVNDWPDRYIHTNFDTAANIDPTKLKRVAFIGAASGYFLANFSKADLPATRGAIQLGRLIRRATALQRSQDAALLADYERRVDDSVNSFLTTPAAATPAAATPAAATPAAATPTAATAAEATRSRSPSSKAGLPHRHPTPRGPMMVFGYDYFEDHAKASGIPTPRLLSYEGAWGSAEEYAYEALNFADGTRSAKQIASALSTEFGPIPEELVTEYLDALRKIGVMD